MSLATPHQAVINCTASECAVSPCYNIVIIIDVLIKDANIRYVLGVFLEDANIGNEPGLVVPLTALVTCIDHRYIGHDLRSEDKVGINPCNHQDFKSRQN